MCEYGFWIRSVKKAFITLEGNAPFEGCTEIDECVLYGFSGKAAGTEKCIDGPDPGYRTIRCKDGYLVTGTTRREITLEGSTPFVGCTGKLN